MEKIILMYYLTKNVFFELFLKLHLLTNLCKPIHDIMNYSNFTCPFESGKCAKEKNYKDLNSLKTQKSFLDDIKSIFRSF